MQAKLYIKRGMLRKRAQYKKEKRAIIFTALLIFIIFL